MMIVERQLPRNSRIIMLVSSAAMTPSRTTPAIAPLTNSDWSPTKPTTSVSGKRSLKSTTFCLMPAMISSVEIEPAFSTIISTERLPSTWTMLVCGGLPSRTVATSRT